MLKVRHNPWDEGGLCPDTDCCEAEDTDRRCAAKVRIHTMAEESRIQRVLKWSSLKDGQEKRVWMGRCGSCNRCLYFLHVKGIGFHLTSNVESVCWMNTWMNLMLHQDKSILICLCRHLMTQWVNISCGADWMILYTPQVSNFSPNQIHLRLPDNYLRITPFPSSLTNVHSNKMEEINNIVLNFVWPENERKRIFQDQLSQAFGVWCLRSWYSFLKYIMR